MLAPVLVATTQVGVTDAGPGPLGLVADILDDEARLNGPSTESLVNPAKALAFELAESIPVFLGDGPASGVAARRAATLRGLGYGIINRRLARLAPATAGAAREALVRRQAVERDAAVRLEIETALETLPTHA